jgi:hypothetical protein
LIPRLRRQARLAREEYALSAATASGRVRGRPTGPRTLTFSSTAMNRGLSAACPGVSTNASGRQRRAAAGGPCWSAHRASDPALPPRAGPGGADAAVGARPARTPQLASRRPPGQFARFPWPLFPRRGPFQRRQDLRFQHHPGRVVMGAGHRGGLRLVRPSGRGSTCAAEAASTDARPGALWLQAVAWQAAARAANRPSGS